MLRVYDQSDLDSFPSGLWGIREPPYDQDGKPRSSGHSPSTSLMLSLCPDISLTLALDADQRLDLIIVPGEHVHRCGTHESW